MTRVYLDQNAVSYLTSACRSASWEAIRGLLVEGFELERIVCPMPSETLLESAVRSLADRVATEEFFWSVSYGLMFRNMSEILIDSTLALVRENHVTASIKVIQPGWATHNDAAADTATLFQDARKQMELCVEDARDRSPKSPEEVLKGTVESRSTAFWRDLEKYLEGTATSPSDYEIGWLMEELIQRGLDERETKNLIEEVRYHRWEEIPVNAFDLLLGSRWDHELRSGKGYKVNDEIDRWRMAVGLAHADLVITDRYAASLCRRARTEDHGGAVVFSAGQTDAILQYIEGEIH